MRRSFTVIALLVALVASAPAGAVDAGADADAVPQALLARLGSADDGAFRSAASATAELARRGSTEAVRALVQAAADRPAAVRAEVGAMLTELGDRAVPGLILEMRTSPSPAVRRFADAQLETMERRMPGEAIQAKSPEILADVLRAYGAARDTDALGVVFSFTNADRELPREAARQAIYDYGALATGKLRESYSAFMGRPTPDDWPPERVAKELFAAYDRDRRKEMYVMFEEAVALAKRAEEVTPPDPALLAKAVEAFDRILARAPDVERRNEMVPAYVFLAQSVEATDPTRAASLYRKAAHLDPTSPRKGQIEGALLALEARALRERGVVDEEMLARAVALDPANAIARDELARLDQQKSDGDETLVRIAWVGAAAIVAGGLLLTALGLRSRSRS